MPLSPVEPSCSVVLASLQLEQVLSLMPETRTSMIKIPWVFCSNIHAYKYARKYVHIISKTTYDNCLKYFTLV